MQSHITNLFSNIIDRKSNHSESNGNKNSGIERKIEFGIPNKFFNSRINLRVNLLLRALFRIYRLPSSIFCVRFAGLRRPFEN